MTTATSQRLTDLVDEAEAFVVHDGLSPHDAVERVLDRGLATLSEDDIRTSVMRAINAALGARLPKVRRAGPSGSAQREADSKYSKLEAVVKSAAAALARVIYVDTDGVTRNLEELSLEGHRAAARRSRTEADESGRRADFHEFVAAQLEEHSVRRIHDLPLNLIYECGRRAEVVW